MTITELVIFLSVVAVLAALGKYLEIKSYQRRAKMLKEDEERWNEIGYTLTPLQRMRHNTATSRLEHLKYRKRG